MRLILLFCLISAVGFAASPKPNPVADCTSSATAVRRIDENISSENDRELVAATLLGIGLRARTLQHDTDAQVITSATGVEYVERHERGRIMLTALANGPVTSITVQCCSGAAAVTQETAEKVAEAMSRQVFDVAFKQNQTESDKLIGFYFNAERPRTLAAFSVGLMKSEKLAVPGATMAEVREAFGEPESNVGAIGREVWTYAKPASIRAQFDNGVVTQSPAQAK